MNNTVSYQVSASVSSFAFIQNTSTKCMCISLQYKNNEIQNRMMTVTDQEWMEFVGVVQDLFLEIENLKAKYAQVYI